MANPFLVLGGMVAGVAVATVGVLVMPGWVSAAQDSQAIDDLSKIREVQSVIYDVRGEYTNSLETARSGKWGVNLDFSAGVVLKQLSAGSNSWCAVVQSPTGVYFGASSKKFPIAPFATEAAAADAVCALPTIAAPTVVTVAETGDTLYVGTSEANCETGEGEYRFRSRSTSTAAPGEWSGWSAWDDEMVFQINTYKVGALYGYQVEARCVSGTETSPSELSTEATHLTGVPTPDAPTVAATTIGGGVLATTTLTTCAGESVPQYRLRQRSTSTTEEVSWAGPSDWSPDNTSTVAPAAAGTRYGFQAEVRCATELAYSDVVSSAEATTTTPIPTPVIPTAAIGMNGASVRMSVTPVTCAAGTTPEYQFRHRDYSNVTATGWSGYSAWSAATTQTVTSPAEGALYGVESTARCATSVAKSTTVKSAEATTITPIATPLPTKVTVAMSGSAVRGTATAISCAAGQTQQYRFAERASQAAADGGFGAWTAWGATAYMQDTTPLAGARYGYKAEARCVTAYTESAATAIPEAAFVTSIATPATPTTTVQQIDASIIRWTPTYSCPTGTTPTFGRQSWNEITKTWTTPSTSSSQLFNLSSPLEGYEYRAQIRVSCSTDRVTGAFSAWSSVVGRVRPVTAPKALSWTSNKPGNGFTINHNIDVCGPGTLARERWLDFSLYSGTADTPRSLRASGDLWGGLSDANIITRWTNGTPAVLTSAGVGSAWVNIQGGASWLDYGQHSGNTISKARVWKQVRCINMETLRYAESDGEFSPMYTPNVAIK